MIGIFFFFAGAGFLDLCFEMTGHFKTLYVNEFKPSFNRIYRYAREKMGIEPPIFRHHVGDIFEWTSGERNKELRKYLKRAKAEPDIDLVGFIGGPPCPDFSVTGKYLHAAEKINEMQERLKANHFTSFWP